LRGDVLSSRAKRGICSFVLSAVALVACEDPFEPFAGFAEKRVLVHAILDASADTQKVLIEITDGFETIIPTDAVVQVTTPTGREIPLVQNQAIVEVGVYFYRLSQHEPLQPGGTYDLRIDIPNRPRVTGRTTIPSAVPGSLVELPTFLPDSDTLRLVWSRVAGARGYEVVVTSERTFPGGGFILSRSSIFADTSISLAGDARTLEGDDIFQSSHLTQVTVLAADDNYHTYYRANVDPFAGAPPSRLTGGAVGFFGSIVPIVRRRFVVACRAGPSCPQPGASAR
jgi:hypothetical protein